VGEKGKRPKNPWLDGFCGVSSRLPPTALNYQIKNQYCARQWHLRGARVARQADYRQLLKFPLVRG